MFFLTENKYIIKLSSGKQPHSFQNKAENSLKLFLIPNIPSSKVKQPSVSSETMHECLKQKVTLKTLLPSTITH